MPAAEKPDPKLLKSAPKAGKPWLIIALVAVVAAGAAGGGAWFLASRNAAPAKPVAPVALMPPRFPRPRSTSRWSRRSWST